MTATAFDNHQDVTLGGGPVRIYQAGPADGPPVVLLHGAMLDTAPLIWRDVLPGLARERRTVAIDWPRHGGSRPWTGTLDQARLEEVLEHLLDHLGAARADLVGLSMGAGVAIGFALNRPERVRRLVLAAPGGLDAVRPWQFLTWLCLRSRPLLRWSAAWLAYPALLRRSLAASLAAGEATPGFAEIVALAAAEARAKRAHREGALDDWQVTAYGPRRMRLNHLPRLHELAVPSLWLRGAHDPLVSEQVMREASAAAPGGRFTGIDGAGHLSPLDRPDRFLELTLAFLNQDDTGLTGEERPGHAEHP